MSTNDDSVPPTPAARIKRRLLLVDDDAAVLLTLKAVLESHDFEVDTAPSTAAAIEKMTSNVYHMVITDARMESETAGRDVIRAARRQPYNPATALLTAYPPADEDWHGAETLLVKPIGIHDLLRQIEVLLVQHEDEKQPHSSAFHLLEKQTNGLRGERRRKVS
jgi:DNA-binding response OmpR family regulator